MRKKEREATKIFIDYIQEYIIMYKTGAPLQKEEINDLGNRLKKLGYRVYMEEPSSLRRDFLAKFKLVNLSKKEKEVLDYTVNVDYRLCTRPMNLFHIKQSDEGTHVYKKKKIRECTNEELLRNHSQLIDIEYEICGGYGEAERINLLNANDEILNREIEIKCLEKKLMNDVNFYNGKYFEFHGTHNGVDYWIVSYGCHPLAYVKADKIDLCHKRCFNDFKCHGEKTYICKITLSGVITPVIGWDYAHFGLNDYSTLYEMLPDFDLLKLKRWTFDEVEKEVFEFIDKYKLQEENETTDIS